MKEILPSKNDELQVAKWLNTVYWEEGKKWREGKEDNKNGDELHVKGEAFGMFVLAAWKTLILILFTIIPWHTFCKVTCWGKALRDEEVNQNKPLLLKYIFRTLLSEANSVTLLKMWCENIQKYSPNIYYILRLPKNWGRLQKFIVGHLLGAAGKMLLETAAFHIRLLIPASSAQRSSAWPQWQNPCDSLGT